MSADINTFLRGNEIKFLITANIIFADEFDPFKFKTSSNPTNKLFIIPLYIKLMTYLLRLFFFMKDYILVRIIVDSDSLENYGIFNSIIRSKSL